MFDLTGKTALITGASGGIGADIARKFHKQGAFVILHGTREHVLTDLANELKTNVTYVVASLGDDEAVNTLIKNAEEQAEKPLDILVNNAGITKDGLVIRMKDADFDAVMNINLRAAFKLSRDAIKGMMKRRYGRIINMTSVVGVTGNAGQANYCASKAGMIGMSKSMAIEVASRGITINCIAPGFIETPMTDVLTEDQKIKILGNVPAGRLGTGAEIAAATVFLASNEAAYMTGQTLHVNGGMAMI
jgi:3-oxoacyl-[acyl-carrier protein] reductase